MFRLFKNETANLYTQLANTTWGNPFNVSSATVRRLLFFTFVVVNSVKAQPANYSSGTCDNPYESVFGKCCTPPFPANMSEGCLFGGDSTYDISRMDLKIPPDIDINRLNEDLIACKVANDQCLEDQQRQPESCVDNFHNYKSATVSFGQGNIDGGKCSFLSYDYLSSVAHVHQIYDGCLLDVLKKHCGYISKVANKEGYFTQLTPFTDADRCENSYISTFGSTCCAPPGFVDAEEDGTKIWNTTSLWTKGLHGNSFEVALTAFPGVDINSLDQDLAKCQVDGPQCFSDYQGYKQTNQYQTRSRVDYFVERFADEKATVFRMGINNRDYWARCVFISNMVIYFPEPSFSDYVDHYQGCALDAIMKHCGDILSIHDASGRNLTPSPHTNLTPSPHTLSDREIKAITSSAIVCTIASTLSAYCTYKWHVRRRNRADRQRLIEDGIPEFVMNSDTESDATAWENLGDQLGKFVEDEPDNQNAKNLLDEFDKTMDEYRCAVTYAMMNNPVTLPCDHTFDMKGIVAWEKTQSGVCTCQLCRHPFAIKDIKIDASKKKIIDDKFEYFQDQMQELLNSKKADKVVSVRLRSNSISFYRRASDSITEPSVIANLRRSA